MFKGEEIVESQVMLREAHTPVRHWQERLRLGRLVYQVYYSPKASLRRYWREGPLNIALSSRAQRRMEQAVEKLPPLSQARSDCGEIHFLSGHKFWYQTCFCAYTMMAHSGDTRLCPVIHDDGTLTDEQENKLRHVLPGAQIRRASEIEARLEEYLPQAKFPTLRRRRLVYPHLRKLTDVHAGSTGWKLVLDSDMLFFRRPDILLEWLREPDGPIYMLDVDSAYGYSTDLMAELAQADIPAKVNVGLCGIRSEDVDWERLESWCRIMLEREGSSYYQEQALTAMMFAGRTCEIAPAEDYVVKPEREDVIRPRGVMYHYVAESKNLYFRLGWEKALMTIDPHSLKER